MSHSLGSAYALVLCGEVPGGRDEEFMTLLQQRLQNGGLDVTAKIVCVNKDGFAVSESSANGLFVCLFVCLLFCFFVFVVFVVFVVFCVFCFCSCFYLLYLGH